MHIHIKNSGTRESGEKPERPRHCNRDETARKSLFERMGRRGSRVIESQETSRNLFEACCARAHGVFFDASRKDCSQ
jgi:hypothetical protein